MGLLSRKAARIKVALEWVKNKASFKGTDTQREARAWSEAGRQTFLHCTDGSKGRRTRVTGMDGACPRGLLLVRYATDFLHNSLSPQTLLLIAIGRETLRIREGE